ncbi:MAG: alpha/beta fold hydrolase [bacterium]
MTLQTRPPSDATTFTDTGSGAPVVLLHGVGMCAAAWAPQIAGLAGHRVIALNMPGHGGSAPLPGTPTLPDYVAWAAKMLQHLNLGPANIVGHSMGALIALGLACDHSGLVRRIALLNGVHRRTADARAAVLARADALANGANDIDAPLSRWFTPNQQTLRRQVAQWLQTVTPQGYAAAYRAFALGDATYAESLGRITCPALFLTGSEDANSTPAMARVMAQSAANGRAVVIDGHRHMVNLTAPDAVNRALTDWLATTEGSRP